MTGSGSGFRTFCGVDVGIAAECSGVEGWVSLFAVWEALEGGGVGGTDGDGFGDTFTVPEEYLTRSDRRSSNLLMTDGSSILLWENLGGLDEEAAPDEGAVVGAGVDEV